MALPGRMPKMAEASRLFPEPEEPATARISPGRTLRLRLEMTGSCFCSRPLSYIRKETDRSETSRRGFCIRSIQVFLLFLGAVGVQNDPQIFSQPVGEQHHGNQQQTGEHR